MQGRCPVWNDDIYTWEFSKEDPPGGIDMLVELTTEVYRSIRCQVTVHYVSNSDLIILLSSERILSVG